jgi:hypothetical protein
MDYFLQTYKEILSLKGIGPYTAAAVASIAFNLAPPCARRKCLPVSGTVLWNIITCSFRKR